MVRFGKRYSSFDPGDGRFYCATKNAEIALGWVLAGLGLLLVVLMATIIGSSVSDGLVKPGIIDAYPISAEKKLSGIDA